MLKMLLTSTLIYAVLHLPVNTQAILLGMLLNIIVVVVLVTDYRDNRI